MTTLNGTETTSSKLKDKLTADHKKTAESKYEFVKQKNQNQKNKTNLLKK